MAKINILYDKIGIQPKQYKLGELSFFDYPPFGYERQCKLLDWISNNYRFGCGISKGVFRVQLLNKYNMPIAVGSHDMDIYEATADAVSNLCLTNEQKQELKQLLQ